MCMESIFKLLIFCIYLIALEARDSLATFSGNKAKACDPVHTGIKVIYSVKIRWRSELRPNGTLLCGSWDSVQFPPPWQHAGTLGEV